MKLTIIIPTYNNDKTLQECLESLEIQDFPEDDFEILVIDGGSTDKTLETAKNFTVKILSNPKKFEEAARIIGIEESQGEIIAFIDADNIVIGKGWIKKMLLPFDDPGIFFADTLNFSYRKRDRVSVRYQALIGGDDQIAMYLGMYNRWCYLYGDWTNYPHEDYDTGTYLKCKLLNKSKVPPMGSNGFFVRKYVLKKFVKNNFIHSDVVYDLVKNGYGTFAKVKTGIIHNQPKFFPNKIRRIKRRMNNEIKIKYSYGMKKRDILKASIYILLIFPVFFDTFRGFVKKPDSAWFFHPLACFGEIFLYGWYILKHKLN